ncbi:hypothetical protein F66182_7323 [Fusarium sp. NRRL 66182]|nr:hypothetical protein F66182_7323 [Fusarium sp. NRRL 66182]
MAFPPQYREPAPALPSIIVPARSHQSHHEIPFSRSPAVTIPGMPPRDDVPPPLPPPRFPGLDQSSIMGEKREYTHGSFASGYGSLNSSYQEDRPSYQRRDINDRDEGYASYSSTDRSRGSIPSFGRFHNHFQFQSPAEIHGDSLKKKLDQTRPLDRSPPRSLLGASSELLSRKPSVDGRFPALQLPIRGGTLGSPARLTETPLTSAVSPRSNPYRYGDRSPNDSSDIDRSPRTRSKRNNSDDAASTNSSYDFNGAEDMEMEDGQSLKRLHIDDAYMAGGQKRRAASPNDEHILSMSSDISRRRDMNARGSPQARITAPPRGATMPSVPASRSNSYISTMSMSMHPAGITAANSFGRRSPVGPSPGGISPTSCNSPYTAPVSLNPSPRTSISGRGSMHSRTVSGASTRKITEVQKPGGTKVQGFFMCECCPKKPKRFETVEELNAHEAEKQYECSFCGNRFKNKNEAERHQNSLHVRRHSWSCSALSGYDRAFHDSTNRPGEADTCGYCGDEFPRSGRGPGSSAPRHATDQDWDERIRHLQEVHKFRECNSSKKFYRADHFRQHLKHSHAGTSGKWTNMLENACMLEEDPTPR